MYMPEGMSFPEKEMLCVPGGYIFLVSSSISSPKTLYMEREINWETGKVNDMVVEGLNGLG